LWTEIPLAIKWLENSLEACPAYLQLSEEEWICLHTNNVVERLNKESKRRTKPMEIVAGERSYYRVLSFLCLEGA
jgi:putative transposase